MRFSDIYQLVTRGFQVLFRERENLPEGVLDLPRGLRMDAISATLLDAELASPGELLGPHQRVEIAERAAFKNLTRLGQVPIVAADPHQQIATADQCSALGRARHATAPRCLR